MNDKKKGTQRIYSLPVEITDWKFDGATEIQFNWEYEDGSDSLLELYEKGKKQQWDASTRLDWSLELDPDNPMQLKDEAISIYDTDYWRKMTDKERSWLRRHLQANSISQFMHGEQGALIATSKIVATVPDMNAKFYAATQVMDEARHVEAYKRLLHEKFQLAYPINKALKTLLEQTLTRRPSRYRPESFQLSVAAVPALESTSPGPAPTSTTTTGPAPTSTTTTTTTAASGPAG